MAKTKTHRKIKSLVDNNYQGLSLTRQTQLLGISRSSWYYQPKSVDQFTLRVMHEIDQIYTQCPFYGVRKITWQLKRNGFRINHKRVYRLMKLMGIESIYPQPNLSQNSQSHPVYPYLLKDRVIDKPQVWGVDITYIRLNKTWLYLVAILDWFSRAVLAWELSDNLEVEFCLEVLRKALCIALPNIHNSDQGTQFTSEAYLDILKSHQSIKISMDSRGRAFDNIFTERLWRTLKYEEVYLKDYQTPREARQSLNNYFKFYNQKRPHQALGYQTPNEVYFNKSKNRKEVKNCVLV